MEETRTIEAPRSWDEYVGQDHLKNVLNVHCESALALDKRSIDPVLLDGPPGCGKTLLASLIARKLGVEFEVMAMTDFNPNRLVELIRRHNGVILLDEIHAASKAQLESLLTLLEQGWYQHRGFRSRAQPDITFVGATTERHKLPPALVDRFKIAPGFDPYTIEDMEYIGLGMLNRLGMLHDREFIEAVAPAAAGIPRRLEPMVIMKRDLYVTDRPDNAENVLDMLRLTHDGLSRTEVDYLKFLKERGICGENLLMQYLRVGKTELYEIERVFLERGFIDRLPNGRMITYQGEERVEEMQ